MMDSKPLKRVLILTSEFPPQPGGIGQHALDLAKQLALYYEVSVIADQRSTDGLEEHDFDASLNFKVHRIKRFKRIARTYMTRLLTTRRYLPKADIILVSGKFSLWQIHLIKLMKPVIPVLAIIHGSEVLLPGSFTRGLTNKALEKANEVIAVSNYTASLVNNLSLKSIKVIPNGIANIPAFKPKSSRSDQINLLTVGNLTQRKGQHNVIKALPAILKEFPHAHYHCVGLPTELSKLQELVKELGLNDTVSFHGRLSEDAKEEQYRQAHVFLMLSERTSSGDVEGFGIAILEANANSLPAVGSLGTGIEDAIDSGSSGYLVDAHESDRIAEAVKDILKNYSDFQKQAYAWSHDFKWEELGSRYKNIIDQLCV